MTGELQYEEALVKANRVRKDAVAVCEQIKAGELTVAAALDDPRAASARVWRLLKAQHGWGVSRCTKALVALGIRDGQRKVRDLSPRQREVLIGMSASWEPPSAPAATTTEGRDADIG